MGEFERKKKQMQAEQSSMPKLPQQKNPGLLHLQNSAGNRAVSELVGALSGVPGPSIVRTQLGVTATVYFSKNSTLLDAANYRAVEQLMNELGYLFEPVITVDGHASGEGPGAQNQSLSERRRETVIALLTAGSKTKPQIKGAGYGEAQAAVPEEAEADGELEKQRAQNRRVEITILYRSRMTEEPKKPILEPSAAYETIGFFNNVVFTCGTVVRDSTLYLYYGAADERIAVASAPLAAILDTL